MQSTWFRHRKNKVASLLVYGTKFTGWCFVAANFENHHTCFTCLAGATTELYHQCCFPWDLSEEALATASITGVYYVIFGGIGFGLNNVLQALISRRAGENKPKAIGALFQQGIFNSLCISAFGILFTYFVAPLNFKASI